MTKETTGSIEREEQTKLPRNYRRLVDDSTIEAMKEYFGVKDYATLFRYVKDVGMKGSSSLADS